MLDEIKQQVETNVAPLVSGILSDTEKLIRQEIALAKAELREDFGRLRSAAVYLVGGVALTIATSFVLLLSLVHGLHAAFSELPLWASYAAVTIVGILGAAITLSVARGKLSKVRVIPQQTIETIKEHAEWIQRRA